MLNNSVIFSGKPIGFEEFLNQMVKALGKKMDVFILLKIVKV